jgi:hypothetical protein
MARYKTQENNSLLLPVVLSVLPAFPHRHVAEIRSSK